MSAQGTATRAAAARAIAAVLSGSSLNQCLPAALGQVEPRDRGLLQQLCYGTLRLYHRLQPQLEQLLSKPLRDKDRDIQALLLLGLYQLTDTRIPDHAAVAATVGATQVLGKHWARGLCNAVLRRYLREAEQLGESLSAAARVAHPAWLYEALGKEWPEQAEAIFTANNAQPPMTLRVNRRQTGRDAYLQTLQEAGIAARPGLLGADAITLQTPLDIAALPGFASGQVSVQDEAAQLAADLLPLAAADRVLDACAAPGGKACHLLERHPGLSLTAMDVDASRLERVRENLARLQLQAQVLTGDAAAPPEILGQQAFQGIIADVPCSATGVIRRHPDVKLLRRAEDIADLADRQLQILQGLWPLLAPGGHLLYITCSVLATENQSVVRRFLAVQPEATAIELPSTPGEPCAVGRQLLPGMNSHDGLYFALLRRQPG